MAQAAAAGGGDGDDEMAVFDSFEQVVNTGSYDDAYPFDDDTGVAEMCDTLAESDPRAMEANVYEIVSLRNVLHRILRVGDAQQGDEGGDEAAAGQQLTMAEMTQRCTLLFGSGSVEERMDRYKKFVMILAKMQYIMNHFEDLPVTPRFKTTLLEDLDHLATCLSASQQISVALCAWEADTFGLSASRLRQGGCDRTINAARTEGQNDHQRVLDDFLSLAAMRMLRKLPEDECDDKETNIMLYKPHFVRVEGPDGEMHTVYTFTYLPYMRTYTFVHEMFKQNPSLDTRATKRDGIERRVGNLFKHTRKNELPELKRHRHWWAWKNGIFNTHPDDCQFYYYVPPHEDALCANDLDTNYVAMHYIDEVFEYDKYMSATVKVDENGETVYEKVVAREHEEDGEDDHGGEAEPRYRPVLEVEKLMELCPTPLRKLFEDQGWDLATETWFMILAVGRNFQPLGKFEKWQLSVLLQGIGGTGKSIHIGNLMSFFDPTRIGIINSEGRGGFPLQHLHKKDLVVCMECGDLDMRQNRFNSLVSNENVTIELMYREAISVQWNIPIIMAGNSAPPFPNDGDSYGRRAAMFAFTHHVKNSDPMLPQKLLKARPQTMFVACHLYRIAVKEYANTDPWLNFDTNGVCTHDKPCSFEAQGETCPCTVTMLPPSLHRNRRKIQAHNDPVFGLLNSPEYITIDPNLWCTHTEFIARYQDFCAEYEMTSKHLRDDELSDRFSRFGVRIVNPAAIKRTKPDAVFKHPGKHILGLGLVRPNVM